MEKKTNNDIYGSFATVYDTLMDNVPYEQWCAFILNVLKEAGVKDGLVLDLGCGTGNMTELLAKSGYDMIGIDYSLEMLQIGMERKVKSELDILYLQQDMRDFELYGTVQAVVSCCDCMNYIIKEDELVAVFQLVNNYLDPSGLFLFDFNTQYKYAHVLADRTIAENYEEASFIWENHYYEQEQINEYDLTLFIQEESGLFQKHEENHCQKAYTLEKIKQLLERAGLEFVKAYDDYTMKIPDGESERIFVVAREKGK